MVSPIRTDEQSPLPRLVLSQLHIQTDKRELFKNNTNAPNYLRKVTFCLGRDLDLIIDISAENRLAE